MAVPNKQADETFDFVVVGSGFGGSVSALRLAEKGYSVLVLEQGKRFRDEDFPKSNWHVRKFLWAPALRCFGIQGITILSGVMVLHGAGVGGGSLMYANVLEIPDDRLFDAPAWKHLADWKTLLMPHYETARRMLGATPNPRESEADAVLKAIAEDRGQGHTFRATNVGVFFGPEGEEVPDPYFSGKGPPRKGCSHCGGCMVGCRHNGKNTLVKNYLYLAEKEGAEIRAECRVTDLRPLPPSQSDGARYEVAYCSATAWFFRPARRIRARNVILSAGVLGTLPLLLRCRDVTRSLPKISKHLGSRVRTNSEALVGSASKNKKRDFSKGVAITSLFWADNVTCIEPVRYPNGSSLMRFTAAPIVEEGRRLPVHLLKYLGQFVVHPYESLISYVLPGWARRTTILLVMQTKENSLRLRLGRSLFTLFRRRLIVDRDASEDVSAQVPLAHEVVRDFAGRTQGIARTSVGEGLLNMPFTAHILGGCPFGETAEDGVIGTDFQIYNYPGLYVIDGCVMPANPGVNPSLTITALAEYAMSKVPARSFS